MTEISAQDADYNAAIAIIGLAARLPGARTDKLFWQNIAAGVHSVRTFSDRELSLAGIDPTRLQHPNLVKAGTLIDDVDQFDAAFFGYTPREAEIMDPQHRLFLECSWEALELAGYAPGSYAGLIGVFGGSCTSSYADKNIFTNPSTMHLVGDLQVAVANDIDALASTVAYKLNLRGPSVAVQTFCSTSLVAVHLACQSLLNYECDIALAGGAAIAIPQGQGYIYQEGGILAPDGYCRAFDAQARGSVVGNGVGVVALKRMEDALADGDPICAVIRGSAINNDGIAKVGYTAPAVNGQAAVIEAALANASVDPETISYIEAHGTGTPLGDSVELAAMIKAFRKSTGKRQFCAIGSVKPNIGHLDRASGVAGLIKTVLALQHRQIPPSLHFERPNPEIGLDQSPFFINTQLSPWPSNGGPRRAGVSSFGLGGTNAHVVLEEAPPCPAPAPSRPYQLLLLTAKTGGALEAMTANLAAHLRAHPEQGLADVAYTLQVGRTAFNYRRALVCRDRDEALALLEHGQAPAVEQVQRGRSVAFVLPGVGEQYAGLAAALYAREPIFRAALDRCATLLQPQLGQDIRALLYPEEQKTKPALSGGEGNKEQIARNHPEGTRPRTENHPEGTRPGLTRSPAHPLTRSLLGRNGSEPGASDPLHRTELAQPALFAVEYALAALLADWGIRPAALLGYSLGEYIAACLAGVFSLEDALTLVAARALAIQRLPPSAMLAVQLDEAGLLPFLTPPLALTAVLTPNSCVAGGPIAAIAELARELEARGVACRPLATTHAFHTPLLAPVAPELLAVARQIRLQPPHTPYLSNVSGTWITAAEATDPAYWVAHLTAPVRLAPAVAALLAHDEQQVLLELGPGPGLSALIKQHPACGRARLAQVVGCLPGVHEGGDAQASLLAALGKLWLLDVPIDWAGFYAGEQRRRVRLPTYPFERQRFWIEPYGNPPAAQTSAPAETGKKSDIADWFYLPDWRPSPLPSGHTAAAPSSTALLFIEEQGLGTQLADLLEADGQVVIRVVPGDQFAQPGPNRFVLRPDAREDYQALLAALGRAGIMPTHIAHLWAASSTPPGGADAASFIQAQPRGFYSLLALAQVLGSQNLEQRLALLVVSAGALAVIPDEVPVAEHAPLAGLCKVVSQECTMLHCRSVDVHDLATGSGTTALPAHLAAELLSQANDPVVAYRAGQRLVQEFRAVQLRAGPTVDRARLREGGVYMITGGLGGVGLVLAEYLARTYKARLALLGRSGLPARAEWAAWLDGHAEDDPISRRIRKVQSLEAAGAEVLILAADVAVSEQLRAAVAQTLAHFGALHGVLHAAGISDGSAFGLIENTTPAQCEAHFGPKVYGLYALDEVLRDLPLDFCVLFSSLASVLGGLSFAGYAAANAFMDSFTHRHNRSAARRWQVVNWDTWQLRAGQHETIGATVAAYEMLPHEGAEALERILRHGAPQIINSTGDLMARFRQWVLLESLYAQRPTIPFERRRFWVPNDPRRGVPAIRRADITDWFAATSWKRITPINPADVAERLGEQQTWLVLTDSTGIGAHITDWLSARNQEVISVIPGPNFSKLGPRMYAVQANSRADYDALFQDLTRQNLLPRRVVHLWSVAPSPTTNDEIDAGLAHTLDQSFYSLLALTQALGNLSLPNCRIDVVTGDTQEVMATERLCPAKATVLGPLRSIPYEYPHLAARCIDLALPPESDRATPALIDLLAFELLGGSPAEPIVALRGQHRWAEVFEPVKLAEHPAPILREQGVYVITGGLGGIGLALAEHLADTLQARLALVGRTPLPPREQWEDILAAQDCTSGTGRRVRIVHDLEARGVEVLILTADVADPPQIAAAVQQVIAHFGAIHGVFHTAGVPGMGMMQDTTVAAATAALAPKVQGTLALAQALREVPLDFLVLFSSAATATGGGPGQGSYCAANAFLDTYARCHATTHGCTIAISWGEWLWDAWQERREEFPEEVRHHLSANRRAYGISFDQGMQALRRILARPLPHVFVTTQDLGWMVEDSRRALAVETPGESQAQSASRSLYPRPELSTTYVAPESELEQTIVAIWGEVLGIKEIGAQDDFLELGGNSLIGLQIIARLRQMFHIAVPITLLFEAPTVAQMAIAVEIILIDKLEQLDEPEAVEVAQVE